MRGGVISNKDVEFEEPRGPIMSWPSRSKDEFVPLSSFVSWVHEGRYVYTLLRLRLSSTGEKCASPSSFVTWGHVVSVPPSPESAGDEERRWYPLLFSILGSRRSSVTPYIAFKH